MKSSGKLAIYLDHEQAKLFDFGVNAIEFKIIESDFYYQDKKDVLKKGESHLHNKEQNLQHKYFENIGEVMLHYKKILLFGPTNAKTELFNFLMESSQFSHLKIKVKVTDKLTENQQLEFVNNYFSE